MVDCTLAFKCLEHWILGGYLGPVKSSVFCLWTRHFTVLQSVSLYPGVQMSTGQQIVAQGNLTECPGITCDGLGSPGEEYFQKSWVGVCGPLPKTLTLFICVFCYPIYDLSKNLIAYL